MNHENADNDSSSCKQASESEMVEKKKDDAITDIAVFQVCAEDKNVAESIHEAVKRLIEVRSAVKDQSSDGFPFKSTKARHLAKEVCLANIYSEVACLNLMIAILRTKTILREAPFDEDTFIDMHNISPWLSHIQRLHGEHMQAIHAHLQQIVANHPDREKELARVFEANLVCKEHNKPAVGRSLDGKRILCSECKEKK